MYQRIYDEIILYRQVIKKLSYLGFVATFQDDHGVFQKCSNTIPLDEDNKFFFIGSNKATGITTVGKNCIKVYNYYFLDSLVL
jgi:hypothetical protein